MPKQDKQDTKPDTRVWERPNNADFNPLEFDGIRMKAGVNSFTRYSYKPQPLRTLDEVRADIKALEKETEGLLKDVINGGQP
jgi:hypothetical protein